MGISAEEWKTDPNSTGRSRSREEDRDYIAGLIREREQLERRGLDERVKLVDAELARLGHGAETPQKRAERRPAATRAHR